MLQEERLDDPESALRAMLTNFAANLWTALPCIIQSFNPAAQTVRAQPTIQARVRRQDGEPIWVNLPILLDVPVMWPSGGGFTLTFPIAVGDECLVIFADRCIDSWWQSGGIQVQAELRMHDLSDGFAFVGVRSKPRALGGVPTDRTQLRSDSGQSCVQVGPGEQVHLRAPVVKVHAGSKYAWDVDGYGRTLTSLGGGTYRFDEYVVGATIQTFNHPINPPETPL